MIKSIIKWLLRVLLGSSALYYIGCRILNVKNSFTQLVDVIILVLGTILNFIASHILAILIVIGTAIALFLLYQLIIRKVKIER